jgi:hypothetical protein
MMAERRIEKPLAGDSSWQNRGAPSKTWGDDNGHAAANRVRFFCHCSGGTTRDFSGAVE